MATKAKVTERNLPGLDVQLYEYETYHRLKIKARDAKEYKWTKSVTAITGTLDKPALPNWYAKKVIECAKEMNLHKLNEQIEVDAALDVAQGAGDRARDHAALIGKQAHEMIYAQAMNEFSKINIDEMEPEAVTAFQTFLTWSMDHKMYSVYSEQVVGSIKFDYAGILDSVNFLEWEGKEVKALIDFSTGKSIWPSKFAQCGGYLQAFRESFLDDSIEMCFILNFKGDGSPMEVYPFTMDEMKKAVTFFGNLRRSKAGLGEATKILKGKREADTMTQADARASLGVTAATMKKNI